MASSSIQISLIILAYLGTFMYVAESAKTHKIDIKYPNLYPQGFDWDTLNQHFIVGSSLGTIHTVSDAGVIEDFTKGEGYSSIRGIKVDARRNRVMAVVEGYPLLGSSALASYDLKTGKRIQIANLEDQIGAANVALDPYGNAYVTNSREGFIWKVDLEGAPSVFCKPRNNMGDGDSGLNGIAYNRRGAFLVTQSKTGLLYKVSMDEGVSRVVQISRPMVGAAGVVVRDDDVAIVVSHDKAWYLKSPDNWGIATIVEEMAMNSSLFIEVVALRGRSDRAYVLGGYVGDRMESADREEFVIQEIEFLKDAEGEKIWVILLIVGGLMYFYFWRFGMSRFVKEFNKKRE